MASGDDLLEMHRRMLVIRGFEERVAVLYRDGEIPGFVHLSIGQEAAAVGACWPLGPGDVITSTHRGHGHCLAKGLEPLPMFAELMARDAGTNRGRGGSMHIADPRQGIFGANGIVAAGLPNKQIAHELDLAESTVKGYVESILRKYNVQTRTEAAVAWIREQEHHSAG